MEADDLIDELLESEADLLKEIEKLEEMPSVSETDGIVDGQSGSMEGFCLMTDDGKRYFIGCPKGIGMPNIVRRIEGILTGHNSKIRTIHFDRIKWDAANVTVMYTPSDSHGQYLQLPRSMFRYQKPG